MENEEINEKILALWKKYKDESGENSPLLYPPFKKSKILFIGLNPSKSKKAFDIIWKGEKEEGVFSFEEFFKKENLEKYKREHIFGEELARKKYNQYYGKFKEILKFIHMDELDFDHIDLFVYRATKEGNFKKYLKQELKDEKNNFWFQQLEIFLNAIYLINPEIIVVSNAFASDIIAKFSSLFKINWLAEEIGHDILETQNRKIPIIFSSMFTSLGALDKYSFRRLKWQIKRIKGASKMAEFDNLSAEAKKGEIRLKRKT